MACIGLARADPSPAMRLRRGGRCWYAQLECNKLDTELYDVQIVVDKRSSLESLFAKVNASATPVGTAIAAAQECRRRVGPHVCRSTNGYRTVDAVAERRTLSHCARAIERCGRCCARAWRRSLRSSASSRCKFNSTRSVAARTTSSTRRAAALRPRLQARTSAYAKPGGGPRSCGPVIRCHSSALDCGQLRACNCTLASKWCARVGFHERGGAVLRIACTLCCMRVSGS